MAPGYGFTVSEFESRLRYNVEEYKLVKIYTLGNSGRLERSAGHTAFLVYVRSLLYLFYIIPCGRKDICIWTKSNVDGGRIPQEKLTHGI